MSWAIKGEFVEACSCNMLCPCWYGVQELMIMDQGWCASPWLIRIEKGESNGVDISGCNVALVSFFLSSKNLQASYVFLLLIDFNDVFS